MHVAKAHSFIQWGLNRSSNENVSCIILHSSMWKSSLYPQFGRFIQKNQIMCWRFLLKLYCHRFSSIFIKRIHTDEKHLLNFVGCSMKIIVLYWPPGSPTIFSNMDYFWMITQSVSSWVQTVLVQTKCTKLGLLILGKTVVPMKKYHDM